MSWNVGSHFPFGRELYHLRLCQGGTQWKRQSQRENDRIDIGVFAWPVPIPYTPIP